MVLVVKSEGAESVLITLRVAVEKCAFRLGIKMDSKRVNLLCRDILDVYRYDSIEDVKQCFKKAGQGIYDFGFNKRDTITMLHVSEWMKSHLEEKAREREKMMREEVAQEVTADPEVSQGYIDEIKMILKESIKKDKEGKGNGGIHEDFWLKQLYRMRAQRIVFKLIRKKVKEGKILSRREEDFIDQWNVRKYLYK